MIILFVITIILVIYYAYFINSIKTGLQKLSEQKSGSLKDYPSISVIIPLRNESRNIERLSTNLSRQSYEGSWEIIFVDDDSSDNTVSKLKRYLPVNASIIKSDSTD